MMYAPAAMTNASQIDTRNQNFFRSPSWKILSSFSVTSEIHWSRIPSMTVIHNLLSGPVRDDSENQ